MMVQLKGTGQVAGRTSPGWWIYKGDVIDTVCKLGQDEIQSSVLWVCLVTTWHHQDVFAFCTTNWGPEEPICCSSLVLLTCVLQGALHVEKV